MSTLQIRIIIVVLVMTAAMAALAGAERFKSQHVVAPDWDQLADKIGDWRGKELHFDPLYGFDPATNSILRGYLRPGWPPVVLYVGFHKDLTKILDIHTPSLCYPAQGWKLLSQTKCQPGVYRGGTIWASEIVVDKQGKRELVMWWYNAGGKPFEGRMRQVYAMLAMALFTGRRDGSIVRLNTPLEADEAAARHRLMEFVQVLLPELDKSLPR